MHESGNTIFLFRHLRVAESTDDPVTPVVYGDSAEISLFVPPQDGHHEALQAELDRCRGEQLNYFRFTSAFLRKYGYLQNLYCTPLLTRVLDTANAYMWLVEAQDNALTVEHVREIERLMRRTHTTNLTRQRDAQSWNTTIACRLLKQGAVFDTRLSDVLQYPKDEVGRPRAETEKRHAHDRLTHQEYSHIISFVGDIIVKNVSGRQSIGVVCSGMVGRAIVCHILGKDISDMTRMDFKHTCRFDRGGVLRITISSDEIPNVSVVQASYRADETPNTWLTEVPVTMHLDRGA